MNKELLHNRFKESGINICQLACDIDVSRNTVRNVIMGRTSPSYYVLTSLTYALNLSRDDIIEIFFPYHITTIQEEQNA